MIMKCVSGLLLCSLLAGCSGRIGRPNPFQVSARVAQNTPSVEGYVWARNDGRRMAGDPGLLRQGQRDQAECRGEASASTGLDQSAYVRCMQRRGYTARSAR